LLGCRRSCKGDDRADSFLPAIMAQMQEDGMTAYGTSSNVESMSPPPLWICTLLGIVMIVAGILALSDIMFATVLSVRLIGLTVLAVGAFEIAHAFWTKGWGGFLWQMLLGALYLAFGLVLLNEPEAGALILTYLLGALLLASGVIRCILSFAYWGQSGWMLLLSGAFGVLAALLILFGLPNISRSALGFLLGVDLLSHGFAWLLYAVRSARETA
jgi:uncharacterized membrane protein HdeD (DUF308 family)